MQKNCFVQEGKKKKKLTSMPERSAIVLYFWSCVWSFCSINCSIGMICSCAFVFLLIVQNLQFFSMFDQFLDWLLVCVRRLGFWRFFCCFGNSFRFYFRKLIFLSLEWAPLLSGKNRGFFCDFGRSEGFYLGRSNEIHFDSFYETKQFWSGF